METGKERPELYFLEPDTDVDAATGLVIAAPGSAVNTIPRPVRRGCRIRAVREDTPYRLYFYTPDIPGELIHTYTYQPEANWTTFCPAHSSTGWTTAEWTAPQDGYVRLAVPGAGSTALSDHIEFLDAPAETATPDWMREELESLTRRVAERRRSGDLALLLLTDTHYAVGCIWPDTLRSLRLAAEKLTTDGVAHLGDLTDGLLQETYTRGIAAGMIAELETVGGRLWCCLGNHDRNCFRGNPGRMSREDCARLYLRRETPWYYEDDPERKLRLLFLDSFDPEEKERYGFPPEEVRWMRRVLFRTPRSYRVLVFSHVPPAAEIHVWSDTIRNGERMLRLLERFHRRRGAVLGWIHGHNHADQIYRKRAFPVIGIGCSKLEDFLEHKPEGSVTYPRQQNTRTQELWDVLLVHPDEGSLDFLRFGAGEDRHVEAKEIHG